MLGERYIDTLNKARRTDWCCSLPSLLFAYRSVQSWKGCLVRVSVSQSPVQSFKAFVQIPRDRNYLQRRWLAMQLFNFCNSTKQISKKLIQFGLPRSEWEMKSTMFLLAPPFSAPKFKCSTPAFRWSSLTTVSFASHFHPVHKLCITQRIIVIKMYSTNISTQGL